MLKGKKHQLGNLYPNSPSKVKNKDKIEENKSREDKDDHIRSEARFIRTDTENIKMVIIEHYKQLMLRKSQNQEK